jgi:2-polyprenyl-6-hydroxyphenyl methylase/3-demethylubiquinone-9 3-methyltransferase
MVVDNDVYNRLAGTWWDENEMLSVLRNVLTPPRFGYCRDALRRLGVDPRSAPTLDIGCGGGFLAEEFTRIGCRVVGIDPSGPSLETARRHAAAEGLAIDYREGRGEALPVESRSFRIVYCCDVLEHVGDVGAVIGEVARVLVPGGIFFFDTINRTLRSKLLYIKLFQEWSWTSFMPPNLHDWDMFIKPREIEAHLRAHGLESPEIVGISPESRNPLDLIRTLRRLKLGRISFAEFSRYARLQVSKDTSVSYIGYACRPAEAS